MNRLFYDSQRLDHRGAGYFGTGWVFFDFEERLAESSADSDELERPGPVVDFETSCGCLQGAVPPSDGAKDGQIVDATIVAALKQRNSDGEKAEIKSGRMPQACQDKPAKLAQKDRDARWMVKFSNVKQRQDGSKHAIDTVIPAFGCKNHVGIDRRHVLADLLGGTRCLFLYVIPQRRRKYQIVEGST